MRFSAVLCVLLSGLNVCAQPTTLPADVQAVVDKMKAAHGDVKSLQMEGKLSRDFDVAGEKISESLPFTASFTRPNLIVHEVTGQARLGSDGKQTYLFAIPIGRYHQQPMDGRLGDEFLANLASQNPLLAMLALGDPGELLGGYSDLRLEPSKRPADGNTAIISGKVDDAPVKFFIDGTTHMLQRVETDMSASLKKNEVPAVNKAIVRVDYTTISTKDQLPAETFAWAPPAGAREFQADDAIAEGEASELVGKPAAAFTLRDLENTEVSLTDLKGSVVVLDFWATWCGPCVASMPSLMKINEKFAPQGLKLFAVNLQEGKKQVQQFLADKALALPVLLDSDGAVAKKYGVSGIPQTVVIGKDGTIRKVIVGFGGDDAPLQEAIESALKE